MLIWQALKEEKLFPVSAGVYSVGKSEVVPTISLAFTLADEYYPHQEYRITAPNKEYELPGVVGYGVYSSRFRIKEAGLERAVPFVDEDSVTAAVEAGKLALDSLRRRQQFSRQSLRWLRIQPLRS